MLNLRVPSTTGVVLFRDSAVHLPALLLLNANVSYLFKLLKLYSQIFYGIFLWYLLHSIVLSWHNYIWNRLITIFTVKILKNRVIAGLPAVLDLQGWRLTCGIVEISPSVNGNHRVWHFTLNVIKVFKNYLFYEFSNLPTTLLLRLSIWQIQWWEWVWVVRMSSSAMSGIQFTDKFRSQFN